MTTLADVRRTGRNASILAVSIVGGLGVAVAGVEPTGSMTIDAVLLLVTATAINLVSSWTSWRVATWIVLLAGALSSSLVLAAIAVVAFSIGTAGARYPAYRPLIAVSLSAVSLNIASRSELGFATGASAVVGGIIAAALLVAAMTASPTRVRRIVLLSVSTALAITLIGMAWTFLAATRTADDLRSARTMISRGVDELAEGRLADASATFDDAAAFFDDVAARVGSPMGAPASLVPVVAQQRRALVELSSAAAEAGAGVSDALGEIDIEAVTARAGQIDLDAVRDLTGPLERVERAFDDIDRTIDDVRNPWLLDALDRRLDEIEDEVIAQKQRTADSLALVRAAPALLGGDGPRNYLVAFTTPSEARGLGGFMGNWAVMSADDGRIELSDFGRHERLDDAIDVGALQLDEPDDWLVRYGQFGFTTGPNGTVGDEPWKNFTMSPQAQSTGMVAAQLFPESGGEEIDGFFALDAIAVSELLQFTGRIPTSYGVELDQRTAADFLLNGQYAIAERPERVDLLEEVSRTVVDRLLAEPLPAPARLFEVLRPLVDAGRVVGWASRPEEQKLMVSSGLAGGLPDPGNGDGVAFTFNNAVGNKIDYFLRSRARYDVDVDAATGSARATLELQIENRAPEKGQVPYVVGNLIDLPSGTNRTYVSIYSRLPVDAVRVDDRAATFESGVEAGYFVSSLFVESTPGVPRTIEVTMSGNFDVSSGYTLVVRSPPSVRPSPITATATLRGGDLATQAADTIEIDHGTASMTVGGR